jgi:hypothetical protein
LHCFLIPAPFDAGGEGISGRRSYPVTIVVWILGSLGNSKEITFGSFTDQVFA